MHDRLYDWQNSRRGERELRVAFFPTAPHRVCYLYWTNLHRPPICSYRLCERFDVGWIVDIRYSRFECEEYRVCLSKRDMLPALFAVDNSTLHVDALASKEMLPQDPELNTTVGL